jgi:hypothetical protein
MKNLIIFGNGPLAGKYSAKLVFIGSAKGPAIMIKFHIIILLRGKYASRIAVTSRSTL